MEKEIYEVIEKWVGKNYGSQEMDDPCYNLKSLSKEIGKFIEDKSYDIFRAKDEQYLREDIESILEERETTFTDEQMKEAVRLYEKYESMDNPKLATLEYVIEMVENGEE